MQIGAIGEFGLIGRFKKQLKTDATVIRGTGDDCAVLALDAKRYQLFTCDMIVEGVDFVKKQDPYLIGRKAVAVSLSDIAACCGLPKHCVIALGLPGSADVRLVDRLFKGMRDIAQEFGVNIVGGDISRAPKLTVDVSMLGVVEKNKIALRDAARPGDVICVSGSLGGSIRGKHLRFTPRVREARYLSANAKVHAMIDISDGLIQDLGHILMQSNVGAMLYEELIPISSQARDLEDALYSGEDFELLFTLSRTEAAKILKKKKGVFSPIGEIVHKKFGLMLFDRRNRRHRLKSKGYRHF